LPEIFQILEKQGGINIAYSENHVPASRAYTYSFTNKTIEYILNTITAEVKLRYKIMNNTVIIYRDIDISQTRTKPQIIKIYDTIYKYLVDTVKKIHSDTIYTNKIIPDTVFFFDTIIISKQYKPKKPDISLKLSYSAMHALPDKIELTEPEINRISKINPHIISTIALNICVETGKKTALNSGLNIALWKYDLEQTRTDIINNTNTFNEIIPGYWNKWEITRYYQITGSDTNWIILYDSAWNDEKVITHTTQDTLINVTHESIRPMIYYLELPLYIDYKLCGKHWQLMAASGIMTGFPVKKNRPIDRAHWTWAFLTSLYAEYSLWKNFAFSGGLTCRYYPFNNYTPIPSKKTFTPGAYLALKFKLPVLQ